MQELAKWKWLGLGVFVVFLGVFVFAVLPYASFTYEKYSLWQSQDNRIELATNSDARLQRLKEQKEILSERLGEMYVGLPKNNELSEVVDLIYREASKANIQIERMEPEEEGTVGTYASKSFRVSIKGQYHDVGRFVNAIEKGAYLIRMKEVALVQKDNTLTGDLLIEPILLKEAG